MITKYLGENPFETYDKAKKEEKQKGQELMDRIHFKETMENLIKQIDDPNFQAPETTENLINQIDDSNFQAPEVTPEKVIAKLEKPLSIVEQIKAQVKYGQVNSEILNFVEKLKDARVRLRKGKTSDNIEDVIEEMSNSIESDNNLFTDAIEQFNQAKKEVLWELKLQARPSKGYVQGYIELRNDRKWAWYAEGSTHKGETLCYFILHLEWGEKEFGNGTYVMEDVMDETPKDLPHLLELEFSYNPHPEMTCSNHIPPEVLEKWPAVEESKKKKDYARWHKTEEK